MIKYAGWGAALLLAAAPAGFGACANCPTPAPPPAAPASVLPVYPGAWDYAESRLFFEGGFLWRSGYRVRAPAETTLAWYRNLLTAGGWTEAAPDTRGRLNEFFGVASGMMTAFQQEDVSLHLASFAVPEADCNYVMVSARFPWELEGGPGGMGADAPLYPSGTVLVRMHQSAADHVLTYELAQSADAPGVVMPYVSMMLQQRGWRPDQERELFRAQLRMDDNLRLFDNDAGGQFSVMAVLNDAFSWHYVFLKRMGPKTERDDGV